MFVGISPSELMSKGWNSERKDELSPNIAALTRWFNKFSFWIVSTILVPDQSERTKILSKWIMVAEECRKINNYNTVMEILAALGMVTISRLKLTWRDLPEKYKFIYDSLEELMENKANFKNYRNAIEKSSKPILPYVGNRNKFFFYFQLFTFPQKT